MANKVEIVLQIYSGNNAATDKNLNACSNAFFVTQIPCPLISTQTADIARKSSSHHHYHCAANYCNYQYKIQKTKKQKQKPLTQKITVLVACSDTTDANNYTQ